MFADYDRRCGISPPLEHVLLFTSVQLAPRGAHSRPRPRDGAELRLPQLRVRGTDGFGAPGLRSACRLALPRSVTFDACSAGGMPAGCCAAGRQAGRMEDALTRTELLRLGWSGRAITAAVTAGRLVRLRKGHYATAALSEDVAQAVEVGGRLACVTELRRLGVWVLAPALVHVQVAPNAGRLRHVDGVVTHWHPLVDPRSASASHVGIVDALVRATGCLDRVGAVAAIDSALNLQLVDRHSLAGLSNEPLFAARLAEADGSAQSGLETIIRLLARDLGFRVRIQVRFAGIGIADVVVEDWIVVETDGSEFHDGEAPSARDRRRDAQHAAAGRTALRFRYSQVVYGSGAVAAAIIGAVEAHRRVQNSGRLAARARRRAQRLGWT